MRPLQQDTPWRSLCSCLIGGAVIAGCASTPTDIVPPEQVLSFLQDGSTTKEEILLRFGLPSAQFEGERILTYRLRQDPKEGFVPVSRETSVLDPRINLADPRIARVRRWSEFVLVLVFDDHHVLQKHNLLKMR